MWAYGDIMGRVCDEPVFRWTRGRVLAQGGANEPRGMFTMRVAKYRPLPPEKRGTGYEERLWITCSAYGKLAEKLRDTVDRGTWVIVRGRLISFDLHRKLLPGDQPGRFRWGIKLQIDSCHVVPHLELDGMMVKGGHALVPEHVVERYKAMTEHLGEGWVPPRAPRVKEADLVDYETGEDI